MPAHPFPPDDPRPGPPAPPPPSPSWGPAPAAGATPGAWGAPPPATSPGSRPAAPPGAPPGSWSTPTSPAGAFASLSHAPPGAAAGTEGSVPLAVMGGFAGAVVAGLAWWAIVATTRMQVTFVALGVGWVVAQAVLVCCARRPRLPLQAIAGAFTLASLAVSEYFVQRTLFIEDFEELTGAGPGIPLWDGFGTAREIVTEGLKDDPTTGLFWLGAVVAAVVVAGTHDAVTQRR
jgi:hypothetical protein